MGLKSIGKTILVAMMFATAACTSGGGGSGGSSASADLTISGTLGTSSFIGKPRKAKSSVYQKSNSINGSFSVSDLTFYAIAFTTPPQIAQASVNADGTFSVTLPGAKGSSVTAIFKDAEGTQVGTVVFEDTSSKDLNGNASQTSSIVLKDSVALGAIQLGTDGKVVIPVTQIATAVGSDDAVEASKTFDPTGTWTFKRFVGTLPTGYQTIQAAGCNDGPCENDAITFVRMAGKKFTPNGSCTDSGCPSSAGSIGTEDRYALSIWGGNYAAGIGACGDKTGFSDDDARLHGLIHLASAPAFDGHTMSFGGYVFTKPGTFGGDTAPFNEPWMLTNAVAAHDMSDCRPMQVTNNSKTFNAWACKAKVYAMTNGQWPGSAKSPTTYGWQVGIEGGGCINTATGKPVNVTNWSGIYPDNNGCTDETTAAVATYGAGFHKNTCTYTGVNHDGDAGTAGINMTCSNVWGAFTDSSGPVMGTPLSLAQNEYLGQPEAFLHQGDHCRDAGDATPAAKLAAYRCYADAYWQNIGSATGGGSCMREYQFNWAATSPADFVSGDRGKPKNAFITNILNYAADGKSATLEDEEHQVVTIQSGFNSSTFCDVGRRTSITFKTESDTKLLINLVQSGQMYSTDPACQAAAKAAIAGTLQNTGGDLQHMLQTQKMLFYAQKP